MFTKGLLANSAKSLSPLPPTPIPAIFSLSLGAIKPRPNTWRGTIKNPAPTSAELRTKSLLEMELPFYWSHCYKFSPSLH